jgi:peptidoglycan/xylan/chitin deacetylase (PgdA/CDA1 family)
MNSRVVILNFHGIGQPNRAFWPKEENYWVEKQFFEAVLDLGKTRSDTLITFDDCNASDFEIALPALLTRGLKAHFYVVTNLIGKKGFLSGTQVKELHRSGMTIGNHGKLHRSWRGLTEWELEEEVVQARACLQDLISDRVRFAACPNGSYDRRVLKRLRASGYERVYTSDRGCARRHSWLQPRNSMLCTDDLEEIRRILDSRLLNWSGLVRMVKRVLKAWR